MTLNHKRFSFAFSKPLETLTVGLIFVYKPEAVLDCSCLRKSHPAYKGNLKSHESQITEGGIFLKYINFFNCTLNFSLPIIKKRKEF